MRALLKNKRGSVAVGVMTILVLVLYVYLVFALQTNSSSIKEEFDDVYVSGRVYGIVDGLESSLDFILMNSFLKSYEETMRENSRKILSVDLNNIFEEKIKVDIEDVFKKILVVNDKDVLFVKVLTAPRKIVFDKENVVLNIYPEVLREKYELKERSFETAYDYNLESKLSFDIFELTSFDETSSVYNSCSGLEKTSGEIQECLGSGLTNYNVELLKSEVNEDKELQTLTFKLDSKKEFFIDGEKKKISFELQFVIGWTNEGGLIIVS